MFYCVSPKGGLTVINLYMMDYDEVYRDSFPSPTGVNYYEFRKIISKSAKVSTSFRPQQGLTIMNEILWITKNFYTQ